MKIPYLSFFGIGETIQDFIRGLLWGAIKGLMTFIQGMLEALIKGIMSFPILQNTYIKEAYQASLAIMLLVIGPKIVYEIFMAFVKDDDAALDYGKKLSGAFLGIFLAATLTITISLANTTTVQMTQALTTNQQSEKVNLGDRLLSSVFVGFGGMSQGGESGADKLVSSYQNSDFNVTQREGDNYVWNFSELMVIAGMMIYIVLLFMITIQIATRIMAIGFYYVIGPLCCLSLTNYQNPQAFTVWKNSFIGQFMMNITQVFLLGFFTNMVGDIGNIGATNGLEGPVVVITQLILYFASFSVILTMPAFVQSMIGGYGAGVMESMNQIRGGLGMAKALTTGLVAGGIAKSVGRKNSYSGNREGGIRGAIAGNRQSDGRSKGGAINSALGHKNKETGGRHGGVRGAILGNKGKVPEGEKGSSSRSGGALGAIRGSKEKVKNSSGGSTTKHTGGALGAIRGTKEKQKTSSGASTTSYRGGIRGLAKGNTSVNRTSSGSKSKSSTGSPIPQAVSSARSVTSSAAKKVNPFKQRTSTSQNRGPEL